MEIISTSHNKDVMVLVSKETVNSTWEDRSTCRGNKVGNSKQPWQGKCWRCAKQGHIAKFPINIHAANVEIMGTWRSVVIQNRINKAREEAIAGIEGYLEEDKTAYERQATSLNKETWKEATSVKTMDAIPSVLQMVSQTLYLL